MMGQEEEYVLKKVCFPDRQGENFGIVTEFSHNCKDKVDLIYLIRQIQKITDYKVFESDANKSILNKILKLFKKYNIKSLKRIVLKNDEIGIIYFTIHN